MPLSADDFVHENSGRTNTTGTSVAVSLAGADSTTAGNTVVIFITFPAASFTPPAGFSLDKSISGVAAGVYHKSEVAAGETSWTFTFANAVPTNYLFSWYVVELSSVDPVEPLDASASTALTPTGNGGTLSTGTTPLNAALNTVVLAGFASATTDAQWSGYTGGLEEVVDTASGTTGGYQLAVARKFVDGTTGSFESTGTLAISGGTPNAGALIVAYRAADSPIVAPLAFLTGFEGGTHGGINSHNGASNLMGSPLTHTGTWGTGYLIQAGSARTGGYGLRVVASATTVFVRAGYMTTPKACTYGLNVRVVSATGTVVVAEVANSIGSSIYAQLLYDSSTTKLGVRAGTTGTIQWQAGTTALSAWVWVDLRVKTSTTAWHVDWRVEESGVVTDQTSPPDLTGQSVSIQETLHLGRNASQTMTADYDDPCISPYYVAYPLGPHQVRLLTVDPAGTPTLSGTSTNFSVFTANGTLAAWNAVNARNAVDEVPPTVSASADGVCQTAVAASDYIEFPMAAPTLAADEIISGVRMLAAMWGGTGTGTGTVGLRSWDGTTETTLIDTSVSYDAGSPTAVSSTEPRWQCAMWPSTNGWTEAELGGAALRFGFSTDATPDMGVDALYLEYATRKAQPIAVFGEAAATLRVEQDTNPNTGGIRALRSYTPADQSATLVYELDGVEQTPVVVAAASNPLTTTIDAADAMVVSRIELRPDEPA